MSIVVPFAGGPDDARAMLDGLDVLSLGPDDELIVADNSPQGALARVGVPSRFELVRAEREGSPAHARNSGALRARRDWLLFLDSDCRPPADLLDRYFARPIPERCALVAGPLLSPDGSPGIASVWAESRNMTAQEHNLEHPFRPYFLTANLLVRLSVWRDLGGFLEGIMNAEDVDFCWRAQEAGWTVELNPDATVVHLHRESVRGLMKQAAVRGASETWVHARWPEAERPERQRAALYLRAALVAPFLLLTGRPRGAALRALDAATRVAGAVGAMRNNRARPRPEALPPPAGRPLELWADEYPVVSETFVVAEARELRRLGHAAGVAALRRPGAPALGADDVPVRYLEDETRLERLRALVEVLARRPIRCLRDRLSHRRWAREEAVQPLRVLAPSIRRLLREPDAHVHAHFAAGAALAAMRAARVAGRPFSLTAHAYDIYQQPRNLEEKLRAADLVTSGCDYTVADLRRIAGPDRAGRVHRIVMGVDPERFRRRAPHPAERIVLGVGRLVEKKGFAHLVRAAAEPDLRELLDQIVILGDGPLEDELRREIDSLGLESLVRLGGRAEREEVLDWLERAAVLAMPCVVAADGDRDSMPVVVKEALAMEVPVVVSDEVGLPELVRPEFGRLVPPADAKALAAALRELLELEPAGRAEMGAAGRLFVSKHANVAVESARLSELIEAVGSSGPDARPPATGPA